MRRPPWNRSPRRRRCCHDAAGDGDPAGSTTAAFLARAGFDVAFFEREEFPRLHLVESLLRAMLSLLDRLGARDAVAARGFLVKHGATFRDQESGLKDTFYFAEGKPGLPTTSRLKW